MYETSPEVCGEGTVDGISGLTDPYSYSVHGPQGNTKCTLRFNSTVVPEGNTLDEADTKPWFILHLTGKGCVSHR